MKHGISTSGLVLLFSYGVLLAHASAEIPGGLNNQMTSPRQRHPSPAAARRFAGMPQHNQPRAVKGVDSADDDVFSPESAGAWQTKIPGGSGTFNAVTAQWQIPAVTVPIAGSEQTWEVTSYIGIDGAAPCADVLFQAGVNTYARIINGAVATEVVAFAEFYPAKEIELTGFKVSIGDTIQVKLQLVDGSLTEGLAEFKNVITGATESLSLTAPAGSSLCGKTASWIIENSPQPDGTRSPFAKFEPYHFIDCAAGTTAGLTTNLEGANEIIMVDDNMSS